MKWQNDKYFYDREESSFGRQTTVDLEKFGVRRVKYDAIEFENG